MTPHERQIFGAGFLCAFAFAAHVQRAAFAQLDDRLGELEQVIDRVESRPPLRIVRRLMPGRRHGQQVAQDW